MAKLEIYVTAEGDNTVSQFYVSKSEHVWFNNQGDKPLEIVVKESSEPGPVLCKGNNNQGPTTRFTVAAKGAPGGADQVKMRICDSYNGKTFKYSAEIEGKVKEDPIIIIGRDSFRPGPAFNLADLGLGLLAGIVLTLVALRLFRKQRPT